MAKTKAPEIISGFNPQLTANFHIDEFACKDGTGVPWNLLDNVLLLAKQLQIIRDAVNEKVKKKSTLPLNSGFRNDTYNEKIGGEDNSYHELAMAGDITTQYLTPKQLYDLIISLIKSKKIIDGGVGLYAGFVHYDIGPSRRW